MSCNGSNIFLKGADDSQKFYTNYTREDFSSLSPKKRISLKEGMILLAFGGGIVIILGITTIFGFSHVGFFKLVSPIILHYTGIGMVVIGGITTCITSTIALKIHLVMTKNLDAIKIDYVEDEKNSKDHLSESSS